MNKLSLVSSVCGAGFLSLGISGCGQPQDGDHVNAQIKEGPTKYISAAQVRQHVIDAGFTGSQVQTMVCLAYAESTFDAWALSYAGARGLFQIMPMHVGTTCPGISVDELWQPATNAWCARRVFNAQGFNAWDPYYFSYGSQYNHTHAHNYLDCMNGKVKL